MKEFSPFKIDVWFRNSTKEWIVEVQTGIKDTIYYQARFPGKTKAKAWNKFRRGISEIIMYAYSKTDKNH